MFRIKRFGGKGFFVRVSIFGDTLTKKSEI